MMPPTHRKKQMSNILAAARPIDDIASRYTDENSKTVCISATADARTTLRVTPEETSSPSTSTSTGDHLLVRRTFSQKDR